MTKKLIKTYKGKLSEVSAQIKAEAEEYKEQEFAKENPNFIKVNDAIVSPNELLDRMVKMGNISKERAEELKKTVKWLNKLNTQYAIFYAFVLCGRRSNGYLSTTNRQVWMFYVQEIANWFMSYL